MYFCSFLMLGVSACLFHKAVVDCFDTKSKKERKWPDLSIRKQVEKVFNYSKHRDNLLFSNKLYEYATALKRRSKILKQIRRCKYILKTSEKDGNLKKKHKKIIEKAGGKDYVRKYHDDLVIKMEHAPQLPKKKDWWVLNTNTNKRVNFPMESYCVKQLTI